MKHLHTAERATANTSAPVTGSPVFGPEFVDLPGLYQHFGIKRSLGYQLIKEGRIKSVSLKEAGEKSGKRLIEVASVRAFLKSKEAKQ